MVTLAKREDYIGFVILDPKEVEVGTYLNKPEDKRELM